MQKEVESLFDATEEPKQYAIVPEGVYTGVVVGTDKDSPNTIYVNEGEREVTTYKGDKQIKFLSKYRQYVFGFEIKVDEHEALAGFETDTAQVRGILPLYYNAKKQAFVMNKVNKVTWEPLTKEVTNSDPSSVIGMKFMIKVIHNIKDGITYNNAVPIQALKPVKPQPQEPVKQEPVVEKKVETTKPSFEDTLAALSGNGNPS